MQQSLSLLRQSSPLRVGTQPAAQHSRHHHWPHGRPHRSAARKRRHLPLPDGQPATQQQLELERCKRQMLQEASSYSEERFQQRAPQPEASSAGLALVRAGFAIMLLPLVARPALRIIARPAARIFGRRMLRVWAAWLLGILLKPRIEGAIFHG